MSVRLFIRWPTSSIIISENSCELAQGDFGYKDEASSGIIDLFSSLKKIQDRKDIVIPKDIDNSVLELFSGDNQSLFIGENNDFPNIKTIHINGGGQSIQVLQINGFTGTIKLTNCNLIQRLNVDGAFGEIKIGDDINIRVLNLKGEGKIFAIKNASIMNSFTIHGSIIKQDLIIDNLMFHYDSDINISFNIYGANIAKLSLHNLDLPATGLNIANSIIHHVSFHQINLEKIKLIGVGGKGFSNLDQGKNKASEMKEFYRQLKHSHDEIGNKTEANKFFAKEMEYYERSLSWKNNFGKKIVSFFNRGINDYGNNWWLPLIWIVVISFGYTFIFDCFSFQCSCGGFQSWGCFSSHWLKNVSQFPTELKNAPNWDFFFYALIMGALIYQFLIALRRISQR